MSNSISPELKDDVFRLFVVRADTYAVQQPDGSYVRRETAVTRELVEAHLKGEVTVGLYTTDPRTNKVKWLCFDVDDRCKDPEGVARRILDILREGAPTASVLLEASRYPDMDSFHVWLFFDPSISASTAYNVGNQIKTLVGEEELEVFPKQEKIAEDEFGNLVKLPLGFHQEKRKWSRLLDKTTFTPIEPNLNRVLPTSIPEEREETKEEKEETKGLPTKFRDKVKRLRPCFRRFVEEGRRLSEKSKEDDHYLRLGLVEEASANGFGESEIVELFRKSEDFDEKKTRRYVKHKLESIRKSGVKPWRCDTIEKHGGCLGSNCKVYRKKEKAKKKKKVKKDEKEEEERRVVYTPFMELQDGRLVEEGFSGSEAFFLVYNPQTESVERMRQIVFPDFDLKPIDNDEVRTGTLLLPSEVIEYGSDEKLIGEVKSFLNRWHEPPDRLSRTLDVFYAFLSYIYDLIPQLPYRRYLAPWGKGKSAWLETLGWICYRGTVLAGSDTDKSVVRKLNNWRGTALIDEADFGDSSFYAFIIKILNIGYDSKTGFYHRSDDNDPNKTLTYCVYGPKLLATRSKYKDLALESRCLTTVGRQNVRPVPLFRMKKFMREALQLRNKLTMWRFRNYHEVKEKAAQLEDKDLAGKVYDGAEGISSRVKQVILPLWLIAGDDMKETLTSLAEAIDRKLKIEDPDYLLELQAKDAVDEIVEEYNKSLSEAPERVNIGYEMNILIGAPGSDVLYEIQLSIISRTVLKRRGMKKEDIKVSDVTSTSKSLKKIFENNLGFSIRIGKGRRRVVQIPGGWVRAEEELEVKKGLDKFVGGGGDL